MFIEQVTTRIQRGGGRQIDQASDTSEIRVRVGDDGDGLPAKQSAAGSHGEAARRAVRSRRQQGIEITHDIPWSQEHMIRSHRGRRTRTENTKYRNLLRHAQRHGA